MEFSWDWSKLPEHRHADAIRFYESRNGGKLMELHNEYQLSSELYCCTVHEIYVIKWFQYGIDNGHIRKTN